MLLNLLVFHLAGALKGRLRSWGYQLAKVSVGYMDQSMKLLLGFILISVCDCLYPSPNTVCLGGESAIMWCLLKFLYLMLFGNGFGAVLVCTWLSSLLLILLLEVVSWSTTGLTRWAHQHFRHLFSIR